MKGMKSLIRKTWPKIRLVFIDGKNYYQVDARKQGTNGKRETFSNREEAEKRAAEIEENHSLEGIEGMNLSPELRIAAIKGEKTLSKWGKSLDEAIAFYCNFLEGEEKRQKSLTIEFLAKSWFEEKAKGSNKALKQDTLNGISEGANYLKKEWGNLRIADLTEEHFQKYLDNLTVSQRRKFNLRSTFSQFFNWCIKRKHTAINPLKEIEIHVPSKDVEILSIEECKKIMQTAENSFPDLLPYHAICLFAGLRPTEATLLTWENIHLAERQITVLGSTSKTGETRNVKIEDTLFNWLQEFKGEKKGHIIKQKGCRTALEKFRACLGYKIKKHNSKEWQNEKGNAWIDDVMRHTFASYYLGKYNDRAHLAEQMGNSLKMIKSHYKRIVSNSDTKTFWGIMPQSIKEKAKKRGEKEKARFKKNN